MRNHDQKQLIDMREALRQAIDEEMQRDPTCLSWGKKLLNTMELIKSPRGCSTNGALTA